MCHNRVAISVKQGTIRWFYHSITRSMLWCYFSSISLMNLFLGEVLKLNKFALACSSKRDVCDIRKCPQNNNWPIVDHPLRFLSRSLGLNWYQETENGLNYLSVLLRNKRIDFKTWCVWPKKLKVDVCYLVKTVSDRLCIPNFLMIYYLMVVQK